MSDFKITKPGFTASATAGKRRFWRCVESGHWRHLHSGDVVWVRPCLVGDPKRGVVEKDYRVLERANELAARLQTNTPSSDSPLTPEKGK